MQRTRRLSRPLSMFALPLLFLMGGPSCAYAQDPEQVIHGTNNFSHRAAECAAFYTLIAQCLKANNRAPVGLFGLAEASAKQAIRLAAMSGGAVGVSSNAMLARTELAMQDFAEKTERSCTNVSVIVLSHGKSCKQLVDRPNETMAAEIAAAKTSP